MNMYVDSRVPYKPYFHITYANPGDNEYLFTVCPGRYDLKKATH